MIDEDSNSSIYFEQYYKEENFQMDEVAEQLRERAKIELKTEFEEVRDFAFPTRDPRHWGLKPDNSQQNDDSDISSNENDSEIDFSSFSRWDSNIFIPFVDIDVDNFMKTVEMPKLIEFAFEKQKLDNEAINQSKIKQKEEEEHINSKKNSKEVIINSTTNNTDNKNSGDITVTNNSNDNNDLEKKDENINEKDKEKIDEKEKEEEKDSKAKLNNLDIKIYKAKALFDFRKVTEWEMSINEGEDIYLVATADPGESEDIDEKLKTNNIENDSTTENKEKTEEKNNVEDDKEKKDNDTPNKNDVNNKESDKKDNPVESTDRIGSIDDLYEQEEKADTIITLSNKYNFSHPVAIEVRPTGFYNELLQFIEYSGIYGTGWILGIKVKVRCRRRFKNKKRLRKNRAIKMKMRVLDIGLIPENYVEVDTPESDYDDN